MEPSMVGSVSFGAAAVITLLLVSSSNQMRHVNLPGLNEWGDR
jgi:hypothetical protein